MMRDVRLITLLWTSVLCLSFWGGRSSQSSSREVAPDSVKSRKLGCLNLSASAGLQLDDPGAASEAFSRAILRLEFSGEFQALFEDLLADRDRTLTHDALFILADSWAARAPLEAAEWLNSLDFKDPRNPYLFSALSQWSSQDPEVALDWMMSHQDGPGFTRDYLLAGVVRGMVTKDADLALKVLLEAPSSPERLSAVEFLTSEWLKDGFESAMLNFERLPSSEGDLRERAIRQLVAHSSVEDFEMVKSWSSGFLKGSEARIAMSAAAAKWSHRNPEAASRWVSGLEDRQGRMLAYGEIGARWGRADPIAAGAWIKENSGGGEFDFATRAVAWATVGIDPNKAFSLVAGIGSNELRDETFEQVGRVWMSFQPERAQQYFASESPIPLDLRERLLESYE
jgi:hypothetical protein